MLDNYLEHETRVKFIDGILAQSQDWQWLITEIENRFDNRDVVSWDDYLTINKALGDAATYFVKILRVCNTDWEFTKYEFRELWEIAKFYIGISDCENCATIVRHNQNKLFFFCIWITKLENSDNDNKYFYDIRLLRQSNYFELIKCDSLIENEELLIKYANGIGVNGLEAPLKCLTDNLHYIRIPVNPDFMPCYEKKILNYNAFSFQNLNRKDCHTWQEEYLLNMLRVSFDVKSITPEFSWSDRTSPDISEWSEDILLTVKEYFNNSTADFVIETINYMKNDKEPSKNIKLLHCSLLKEVLGTDTEAYKIFSSSSYSVLSRLHEDKMMQECSGENEYVELLGLLHSRKELHEIILLKENGFPVTKEQNAILDYYINSVYMSIDNIKSLYELLQYLQNGFVSKKITTEYMMKVREKFDELRDEDKTHQLIPSVYYAYMLFLVNVNNSNQNADKSYVQREMIHLQEMWQNVEYENQVRCMNVRSYEQTIEPEHIEQINGSVLIHPIYFAQICTPTSEKSLLKIMETASKYALPHLSKKMIINPIFPMERKIIHVRHEINDLFRDYIDNLIKTNGYKFLNILKSDEYLNAIYERFESNTYLATSMFKEVEKLYLEVKKETTLQLVQYSEEVTIAMVAQLFPVMEIKIRDLAKLVGIFTFKENPDELMKYKDPSSLLRELLSMIYVEQQSFENVEDLFFVYNVMFNGNSLNVRNECIHGRDYLSGDRLKFAFILTLLSIHMIDYRIKIIKLNVGASKCTISSPKL